MFTLDKCDRYIQTAILSTTPVWVDFYIDDMEISFTRTPRDICDCGEYEFSQVFPHYDSWKIYKEYIEEYIINPVNSSMRKQPEKYWRAYSYTTNPVSHYNMSLSPRTLYFGLELEHKGVNNLKLCSSQIKEYAIVKYDDSVDLELVTIPLQYKEWPAALSYLNKWIINSQGDEETGMHLHISRSVFTQEAIERFIDLWGYMSEDSRWYSAFGRRPNDYCGYKPTSQILAEGSKYTYVGASHSETLEVRVFRHTNDPKVIMQRIKLVCLTYKYCMRMRQPVNYDHFVSWYRKLTS